MGKYNFLSSAGNILLNGSLYVVKSAGKSAGYVGTLTKQILTRSDKPDKPDKYEKTSVSKKNESQSKIAGLFTGGLRKKFGLNKSEVKARMDELRNQIENLYLEMGKIGSNNQNNQNNQNNGDSQSIFENKEVQEITLQIEKYEKEFNALNKYLSEAIELEKQNIPLSEIAFDNRGQEIYQGVDKKIQQLIATCIRKEKFSLKSDAIIFQKVLNDLLDKEIDIRRLAVCQLGKIGNKSVAPILKEALKIKNDQLQAEVINTLIQLDDSEIFTICKNFIKHEYALIRTACARGLYKTGRAESIPILIATLQDENAEVRNSSAMFLGWLDAKEAVPSLLQAISDVDKRVRLSAIASLSNIRDEAAVIPLSRSLNTNDLEIRQKVIDAITKIIGGEFNFNVNANEVERAHEISSFKDWYLKKKHGMATTDPTIVATTAPTTGTDE
ncbi:MAG: HEAT repeat domain-containing protein [Oligoflexia bacterium]|nr:HEAT repeat domain-containing protein [Oligoflexia bacterium]